MNMRMMLMLALSLLFSVSAIVTTSDAATTFGGSRIIAIDKDQRTITFKTKEGETWTLPVTDPDLLDQPSVAKEGQVTIEIDLDDRITKVVKPSEMTAAPRAEMEDR